MWIVAHALDALLFLSRCKLTEAGMGLMKSELQITICPLVLVGEDAPLVSFCLPADRQQQLHKNVHRLLRQAYKARTMHMVEECRADCGQISSY